MINLVQSLCVHLVIHSQRLAEQALRIPFRRCAVWCANWRKLPPEEATRFAPGMTQQELALLLGMHRTTLTRILCRLREMNVLGRFTRHELRILDRVRLEELAGKV